MSDMQIDVNKIIESLTNQIAQQAQKIAVLEATIASLRMTRTDNANPSENAEHNN
jgi:uncharacterized coiled-coil protein SlyX